MTIYDYFMAGYNLAMGQQPPYPSSTVYMAFYAGVWCRRHNLTAHEIKAGRGYKMIVNRQYSLDFKRNDQIPDVQRIY